jgi:hypothetical protein
MSTYGEVKGVAALYWAAWARRNSDYHVLCVLHEPVERKSWGQGSALHCIMMPNEASHSSLVSFIPSTLGRSYVDAVLGTEDRTKFESGVLWRQVKVQRAKYVIKPRSRRDANMATKRSRKSSKLWQHICEERKQEALNYIS